MKLRTGKSASMRNFVFVFILFLLVSCGNNATRGKINEAERIIENKPDSALAILDSIDRGKLNVEADRADYGMLYTMAKYKCYIPISPDSLLSESIDYYEKKGDNQHLANALYYKGAMLCETDLPQGMKYLKRAEDLADKYANNILKIKVYYNLAFHNEGNIKLDYCKKLLALARQVGDTLSMYDAYGLLAGIYYNDDHNEVMTEYYLKKQGELIERWSANEKSLFYANIATLYMGKGLLRLTKYAADKSFKYSPNAQAFNLYAYALAQEGKIDSAKIYFNKAINIADSFDLQDIYGNMAEVYEMAGNYKESLAYTKKFFEIKEAAYVKAKNENIIEIQKKYDKAEVERTLYKRTLSIVVTLVVVGLAIIVGIAYHRYRVRKFKHDVKSYTKKVYSLNQLINIKDDELRELLHSSKSKSLKINRLIHDIENQRTSLLESVGKGFELYESIKNKQSVANISDDEINSLMDFYKVVKPQSVISWNDKYEKLSLHNYLFLIVEDLQYSDFEKAAILGIAESSLRSMRTRVKKKQKLQ